MRLMIYFLSVSWVSIVYGENIHNEQFPFPLKYSMPNSYISTDSTIYLPREFQTAASHLLPNFNHNQPNKQTSVPGVNIYPPSTISYADINNLNRGENHEKHSFSPAMASNHSNKHVIQEAERRNFMTIPQINNNKQHIDRMDTKITQFTTPKETKKAPTVNQNPMSRGVIISADNNKNHDLEQEASFHRIHYATPPPHITVYSTTEPAIPILRLSNEMDLDGSFSYEALGADQTHYVQHSRMENIGTDKEGSIVEGSYSYVGDDGQTYTVHYIADSNGYRATGDHLPVPPPIPEIIQRSIQYNLAEEAKRPPNYQSFNEGEYDSSPVNNDKLNVNYYTTPRSLFTGRTPEAFSIGFSPDTNSQSNLTPMATSKEQIKTNVQISDEKTKINNNYGPLEPEITFLASQGAHAPSSNSNQKAPMPQLIYYESGINELDQDNNKGLWRWQYGVNNKNDNENLTKNSISRSSGEGEDVIINFSDMTPEEYTNVIRKQLYTDIHTNLNNNDYQQPSEKIYNYDKNYINNHLKDSNIDYKSKNQIKYASDKSDLSSVFTSENSVIYTTSENPYDIFKESYKDDEIWVDNIANRDKIVQQKNYYTSTSSTENIQLVDQDDSGINFKSTIFPDQDKIHENKYLNYDNNYNSSPSPNPYWTNNYQNMFSQTEKLLSNTPIPIKYNYNIKQEDKTELLLDTGSKQKKILQNKEQDVTTTEPDIKDAVRQNIFLRNLLIPKVHKQLTEEVKKNLPKEIILKNVSHTLLKPYNETKSYNQIKTMEKRPFDVSDVLSYIVNRNVFESNRLKMKNQSPPFKAPIPLNSLSLKPGVNNNDRIDDSKSNENKEDIRVPYNNLRQNPPHELRGNIKNYKVLLRNNERNTNTEAESQSQPISGLQNKNMYIKYPPLGRAGPSMKSYLPPIYL